MITCCNLKNRYRMSQQCDRHTLELIEIKHIYTNSTFFCLQLISRENALLVYYKDHFLDKS